MVNLKVRLDSLRTVEEDLTNAGIHEKHIRNIITDPFVAYLVSRKAKRERLKVGNYLIIALVGAILSALCQLVPENLCRSDPVTYPPIFGWWSHGVWHLGMSWSLGTIAQAILYYHMLDVREVPFVNDRFNFSGVNYKRRNYLIEKIWHFFFLIVLSQDQTKIFDMFSFDPEKDASRLIYELRKQQTQLDLLHHELRKTKEELDTASRSNFDLDTARKENLSEKQPQPENSDKNNNNNTNNNNNNVVSATKEEKKERHLTAKQQEKENEQEAKLEAEVKAKKEKEFIQKQEERTQNQIESEKAKLTELEMQLVQQEEEEEDDDGEKKIEIKSSEVQLDIVTKN